MKGTPNPARLVIALSVAAVLAVFLLYTSIVGGGTPVIPPSDLHDHVGASVTLTGVVHGRISGDATSEQGLTFRLRDRTGTASVLVVYRGSVPDMFGPKRELSVKGESRRGRFIATPGTMVTKCPSKFQAAT